MWVRGREWGAGRGEVKIGCKSVDKTVKRKGILICAETERYKPGTLRHRYMKRAEGAHAQACLYETQS